MIGIDRHPVSIGSIDRNFLNPLPTLIPAIEDGWVESVYCFGGETGMERCTAARPDVFFTGRDGVLSSNRVFGQNSGHYAADMFVGSTLQLDIYGNSSTVTKTRLSGFGGAPNMGCLGFELATSIK
jgi:malonate decarboxylase alpha subunit